MADNTPRPPIAPRAFTLGDTNIPIEFDRFRGAEGPWFTASSIARAIGLAGGASTIERFAQTHRDDLDAGDHIKIGHYDQDGAWQHAHSLFHLNAMLTLILLAETPQAQRLKRDIMRTPMSHSVHAIGEAMGLEVAPEAFAPSGPDHVLIPTARTLHFELFDRLDAQTLATGQALPPKRHKAALRAPNVMVIEGSKPPKLMQSNLTVVHDTPDDT